MPTESIPVPFAAALLSSFTFSSSFASSACASPASAASFALSTSVLLLLRLLLLLLLFLLLLLLPLQFPFMKSASKLKLGLVARLRSMAAATSLPWRPLPPSTPKPLGCAWQPARTPGLNPSPGSGFGIRGCTSAIPHSTASFAAPNAARRNRKSGRVAGEGEDEEGEGDVVLDSPEMRKWLLNPPSGFSTDDVTDTSLEDKLLEEISQSKKGVEFAKKRVDAEKETGRANEAKEKKEKDFPPADGIRVRVSHLPKKRNIKRDLLRSFPQVPGLVHIFPCETGSLKTREPLCKGYAIFTFQSISSAQRFVTEFDGYDVEFGKVNKRINCKLLVAEENENQRILQGSKDGSTMDNSDTNKKLSTKPVIVSQGNPKPTTIKKLRVKEKEKIQSTKRFNDEED